MRLYEWDITRWVTSRTRAELDPVGRYIYRELLDLCYAQGKMPKDHETLARYCGVAAKEFDRHWPKFARHFHTDKHDQNSLLNDFATVARKSYFRYCAKQKKNREKRGQGKDSASNDIRNGGQTTEPTVVPPIRDEKRREETRREHTAATAAPTMVPPPAVPTDEWPAATDAVCSEFTTTEPPVMLQIIQAAAQAAADAGLNLTDSILVEAIREARKQKPDQYSAMLYATSVPAVIRNWAREAKRGKRA